MDLSAGAAIREDAFSAAGACCCCCCFDDDCSSCFFTFGHTSYWYDISRVSYYYCCIYLLSVQSPAPASSLAELPPAASPQLGRWVCEQGLRSARIRGLLLLLAAASAAAASTTTALPGLLRLVTFRTGMTVILLLCYGFSRYGIRVTLLYALVRVARGTACYCSAPCDDI